MVMTLEQYIQVLEEYLKDNPEHNAAIVLTKDGTNRYSVVHKLNISHQKGLVDGDTKDYLYL